MSIVSDHFTRAFGRDLTNIQVQHDKLQKPNLRNKSAPRGSILTNLNNANTRGYNYKNPKVSKPTPAVEQIYKQIAKEDKHNPSLVSDYQVSIFSYLRFNQKQITNPQYMNSQTSITSDMRAILYDWLIKVHIKFKLVDECLFMAINLIDRYLEKTKISRDKFQLLGITCLFISSKVEEIYPPHIKDFASVTNGACTKYDIIRMEGQLCKVLEFNLCIPSSLVFLNRYSRLDKNMASLNSKEYYLARYLLELSFLDSKFLQYTQANIAASSVYLSNQIFDKKEFWNEAQIHQSQFSEKEIRKCALDLYFFLQDVKKNSQFTEGVRNKFRGQKYLEIADISITYNNESSNRRL
ncbi:Cyclin-like protein [Pseudocohnilembus persalinus]|uniref:Cyclin-like protein n=1 Tax=Pseudocohnilembus persalinus TaxID=266149 RepID=A0A0V0QHW1_PSEPJ|nr:Cyclin-like protein [Pseudocohnilembus persalinus]|eukprot:KRX01875.1 Cyclin-like protein [Pseudocohnilembus persalinus]